MHRHVHRLRERSPEAGLTIVEVMIASAILLVVVSAVLSATYVALRLQGTSRQRATATFWAEHLMELARNKPYDRIGLSATTAEMTVAVGAVPAGDTDNPDLRLRKNTGNNCLEFNAGTAASPNWERLVLADWHTTPGAASNCALETNSNFELRHAGGPNDHVATGTPNVTYQGWVYVTWAPVADVSAWYKRVTVVVRYPSPTGGVSRLVQMSSLFSLGYVPSGPVATTTSTMPSATTTTTPAATTTTVAACAPKAGDAQAPSGAIDLAGGAGYTRQPAIDINNTVTDLPNGSGASGLATMAYSNASAAGPFLPSPPAAYGALHSGWPIPAGDGLKTVWGQIADCNGNATVFSDTITLDQTLPPAPTLTGSAGKKKIDLSWTAVTDPGGGDRLRTAQLPRLPLRQGRGHAAGNGRGRHYRLHR